MDIQPHGRQGELDPFVLKLAPGQQGFPGLDFLDVKFGDSRIAVKGQIIVAALECVFHLSVRRDFPGRKGDGRKGKKIGLKGRKRQVRHFDTGFKGRSEGKNIPCCKEFSPLFQSRLKFKLKRILLRIMKTGELEMQSFEIELGWIREAAIRDLGAEFADLDSADRDLPGRLIGVRSVGSSPCAEGTFISISLSQSIVPFSSKEALASPPRTFTCSIETFLSRRLRLPPDVSTAPTWSIGSVWLSGRRAIS